MSNTFRYAIIRYYPWSERDEFINVGVILEGPGGVIYRLLEPRTYRLTTVLERDELEELWEALEFSLFRTREFAQDRVQRESKIPRRLSAPLEKCLSELPSELQCSDIRTIFLKRDDAHLVSEYLHRLFDREVVPRIRVPKRRYLERRHLIKPRLRTDLIHWQVLERLLQAQDLIVTVAWPMDFLYRWDGFESGIRVLDCGVKTVGDAIRVVYGADRDIEESDKPNVSVIAVVGNQDAKPDVYQLITRVLSNRPALRLIQYDTEQGKEDLRRMLQPPEISRKRLIP